MKKAIAIIMFLLLMIPSACAKDEAAEILAGFTDEELQALAIGCRYELLRRSGEGFTLEPGVYISGDDFPEGSYRIDIVNGFAGMADVYVYANNDMYVQQLPYIEIMLDTFGEQPSIGRVYLQSGVVLYITGTMHLEPYTGVQP